MSLLKAETEDERSNCKEVAELEFSTKASSIMETEGAKDTLPYGSMNSQIHDK